VNKNIADGFSYFLSGIKVIGWILFGLLCLIALFVGAVCLAVFLVVIFATTKTRSFDMGDGQHWSWKNGFFRLDQYGNRVETH